ncbi:MAG TPA: hypothetical protein PKC28_15045 [Bdellovibrionales bacterium]|nr:hypothetical protein [Bdellovibrionales bacterium]
MAARIFFAVLLTSLTFNAGAAGLLGDTPNAAEREKSGAYRWNRSIEVVNAQGVDGQLGFEGWMTQNQVGLQDFQWLTLKNLDVGAAKLEPLKDGAAIVIPVGFDIRYMLNKNFREGTLNVAAELVIKTDGSGRAFVEVRSFDDSQILEKLGRAAGALAMFNQEFVVSFSRAVIENHFANPEELRQVWRAARIKDVPPASGKADRLR